MRKNARIASVKVAFALVLAAAPVAAVFAAATTADAAPASTVSVQSEGTPGLPTPTPTYTTDDTQWG
ncbi:hypothetical protein BJY16_009237 [Actinoplanes octamycinicus]|uniref:Uncharacterized protein n=1 Tax=Actinoplanes octamycinicus TaxID=135948 RepID=A0A7W7H8E9_9ACTN|nr:hypothetical protein [Actinoplanes octamycinicus]MBB4745778.1 hypothetical protein [Actinoplanes octamycinicus]GIE63757.1 hypothetical protein Aoc01nite_91590 [Actinoplanes octamycinicus]